MTATIPLRCRCGRVRGEARSVSPDSGKRILCYCEDCQAFARFLNAESVLDAHGGTDIFQLPQAHVRILEGAQELRCVRLSSKGMYRFYTDCCRTPIANLMSSGMAFTGMIHAFIDHAADGRPREAALGPAVSIYGREAIGGPLPHVHPKLPLAFLVRVSLLMTRWLLARKHKPSPFFDAAGRPAGGDPQVLTPAERQRLRLPAHAR